MQWDGHNQCVIAPVPSERPHISRHRSCQSDVAPIFQSKRDRSGQFVISDRGAHAIQLVSALLRHGPGHLRTIRREVETWMAEHEWESLSDMRGNMSLERLPDPAAYERANFRMALR